jgi:hypothetical protein
MDIKDKIKEVLTTMQYDHIDKTFVYNNRYFLNSYKTDDDFDIMVLKLNKIVEKLNSFEEQENLNEFLNRDFDNDIWLTL